MDRDGRAPDVRDLQALLAVVRAGGFRGGAQLSGASASGLSEAVRRLERQLGVRLVNRTTRSVSPTEAGLRLVERLMPALAEIEAALDVVNLFRERPAGTLRLNVPVSAAAAGAAGDRAGFLGRLPRHQARGDRRGELRRRAGDGLRRRHPLRRAARAGHGGDPDRAARAALGHRRGASPIWIDAGGRRIRATCSATPACAAASRAGR